MTQDSYSSMKFSTLRGVRWRIHLGTLPSSPSASIEELRRVAADCRRRYASLRRRLLIDPHLSKDGSRSPNVTMDNPLSQNPESTWGRFFRNAELEKLVDKDLSRLYPEHEQYFQTAASQAMLRRILLVWCLRHPEYGYRQGMHELLAPLLYVLHVDLEHLSHVRVLYEDYFSDEFDEMSYPDNDLSSDSRHTKASRRSPRIDNDNFHGEGNPTVTSLDDLNPEAKEMFLLSDAYGAEGELGVILSERFMEHDAYCMFDALMSGSGGVVAMADFFSPSATGSSTGLPPVIEASSALYHVLSIVDSSLHGHLIELGVEPQYFALRWLRVLFGREFSLDDLLLIWDELFSSSNPSLIDNEMECNFKILCSSRGAFILSMAVSMLLHLRSSLLATENATSCLQRLLNFPRNVNVEKLIEKAKSWQTLALEANVLPSLSQYDLKPEVSRLPSLPTSAGLAKTLNQLVPDSYWEEKWRVLNKDVSTQKNAPVSQGKIKKILGDRFGLGRTESDPSAARRDSQSTTARRRLLDGLTDGNSKLESDIRDASLSPEVDAEKSLTEESSDLSDTGRISDCATEESCLSGENSSAFSTATSPRCLENDQDNVSEKSVTSSFVADAAEEHNQAYEIRGSEPTSSTAIIDNSSANEGANEAGLNKDGEAKQGMGLKDRKLSGKLHWLMRFVRGSGEGKSEKGACCDENVGSPVPRNLNPDSVSAGEAGDKKVTVSLKNLGHAMLENIQVIESVLQIDMGQAGNVLGGKGQAKAMEALKELRRISNLLSETVR